MSVIEKAIEINVPVKTAYNQWTQFEEFPRFMEGVEQVRQIDDKHLHWKAQYRREAEGMGCRHHRADPRSTDLLDEPGRFQERWSDHLF
ncbi:MAG TPA: SRPBCC family protein [Nitrospira sp.]|nr:SRPBCC family protein [Nitrospira sp.]